MEKAKPQSALRALLTSGAGGGMLLILAAAAAMTIANSAWGDAYFAVQHLKIGPLSALHWVNDALMALFFLLVGLEIKREALHGELTSWKSRRVPGVAALAGMAAPALIFLAVTRADPLTLSGWAIPTATDIAFALALLALAGSRVPASLKLFLTTVAVIDDLGAVLIIAIFYTAGIALAPLVIATGLVLLLIGLNRYGVRQLWAYLLPGVALWDAVHASGIHATLAGILVALCIPAHTGDERESPLHRLEHRLAPLVNWLVLPLFGFANAGVRLEGLGVGALLAPLPLGIAAGLFVGKQASVFLSMRAMQALGWHALPAGASWRQLHAVAVLCGIGFTMSLFIGGLAFADPLVADQVKIGVLGGSLFSALLGWALLKTAPSPNRKDQP